MAKYKGTIEINTDRCKGCGLCITACPAAIIVFRENSVNIKGYQPVIVKTPDNCTGCGSCTLMCPDSVITVKRTIQDRRAAHV